MEEREIKKRVDEDWKKKVQQEKHSVVDTPATGSKSTAVTSPAFMNFISNLAAQAMMHMGLMEHPMTGQAEVNLDQAQFVSDLFKTLEEKTKGNLSKEEETALKSVMNEIMMAYVKISQGGQPAPHG